MPAGPSRRCTDGARILDVEDSEDLRLLMQVTLEGEGYQVDTAETAERGLGLVKQNRYDLLLTDFSLPGHSGAWLLDEARSRMKDLPTLMVTGHPDALALEDDIPVVPKPLDFEGFLPQIRAILADRFRAQASKANQPQTVELVLYVSPDSIPCARALRVIDDVLSRFDGERVRFTICDVTREPEEAAAARVVFTPALVKRVPPPPIWVLGALTRPAAIDDLLSMCGIRPRVDPGQAQP